MTADERVIRVKAPDLRLSLAIGSAIVVQTALALVWAGAAAERIAQLERNAISTDRIIERTVRLEEQVLSIRATVTRIEKKLDSTHNQNRRGMRE